MPIGTTASVVAALPDLSTIRKRKEISLAEIATHTKISTRYLEAIEQSEFDLLPGGVFSTSYIRQYARAIDYDEWDLLAYYDAITRREDTPKVQRGADCWVCCASRNRLSACLRLRSGPDPARNSVGFGRVAGEL